MLRPHWTGVQAFICINVPLATEHPTHQKLVKPHRWACGALLPDSHQGGRGEERASVWPSAGLPAMLAQAAGLYRLWCGTRSSHESSERILMATLLGTLQHRSVHGRISARSVLLSSDKCVCCNHAHGQRTKAGDSALTCWCSTNDASGAHRRFFPALQYLSTSKIAIAVAGNFAFAVALCVYQATVKVCAHPHLAPTCGCQLPSCSNAAVLLECWHVGSS